MKTYSGPDSVLQHVNRFAIATLLTGVGLLALAWPAQAKIVYTKVNVQIPSNSSYNLDLNNEWSHRLHHRDSLFVFEMPRTGRRRF